MTSVSPSHQRLEPSAAQLLARLEQDIAWLKNRRLWSPALFERGVRRYVIAQGSNNGLEEFQRRHAPKNAVSGAQGAADSTA